MWDGLRDRGWHTYTTMHKVVHNETYCGDLHAKGIQEGMYVFTWLILFATQQKWTRHCKATILLLKKQKQKHHAKWKGKKEYTLYFLFIRNFGRRKTHLSWRKADQWLSRASSVDGTTAQGNFTDDRKVLFRITPWLEWWFPKWCIYQSKTLSKQYT